MSDVEFRGELCAVVYGKGIMSEGNVRRWCRMLKNGRSNVHDKERSGRPFVASDDFVQSVDRYL